MFSCRDYECSGKKDDQQYGPQQIHGKNKNPHFMQNFACHGIKQTLACSMTITLLPKIIGKHGISKINNWGIRDLNNFHLLLVLLLFLINLKYRTHSQLGTGTIFSFGRSLYRPFTCERRTMYLTVVKEFFLKTWQNPNGFPNDIWLFTWPDSA